MRFKAKLRRIGNSVGILIPRDVITGIKLGDEIDVDVITNPLNEVITEREKPLSVITPSLQRKVFNSKWCEKHNAYRGSCGCK